MIAFWWEDWPGTRLRSSWSGWADTVLIAAGAIVLTGAGQTLAGRLDPGALFDPSPGPGHVPTFPATMPLAGLAFVATLEITLVGEGWPLRRLHPLVAGPIAVAIAWAVAIAGYLTVVQIESPAGSDVIARDGPVPGAVLGATLVLIGAWQVLCFVVWRGWPFATVASRAARLTIAHVTVIGGGIVSYLVLRELLGLTPARIAALSGCFIAAGLLFGMLLEGWLGNLGPTVERAALLLATRRPGGPVGGRVAGDRQQGHAPDAERPRTTGSATPPSTPSPSRSSSTSRSDAAGPSRTPPSSERVQGQLMSSVSPGARPL